MAETSHERPIDWKIQFALLLLIGLPAGTLIRVYWIPHTLGAFGVGITVGYAVVLVMIFSGRGPRERTPATPVVRTQDALVYFQAVHTTAWISVVNASDAPLRVPGLADGVAVGLTVDVLQGDRQLRIVSLDPGSRPILELPRSRFDFVTASFDPQSTPSGRTVRVDIANALKDLPKGRYDLRWRWDLTALAAEGLWTPGEPVVLGMTRLVLR